MSERDVASLGAALLVMKGTAAPWRAAPDQAQARRPAKSDARRRISIRIDPGLHLRLRLAAAHLGTSARTVLVDALEQHLANGVPGVDPRCGCLRGP
jgi:hypothetical protein